MSEFLNNHPGGPEVSPDGATSDWLEMARSVAGEQATHDGQATPSEQTISSEQPTATPVEVATVTEAIEAPAPTLDDYLRDARRNLMAMSRTAQGVVDTSASVGKADAMTGVTGDAAADLAQQNYDAAIRLAYENRGRDFTSPAELREFVESLAATINRGIVKDGNLIRSTDSAKYPYVRIANLANYADKFYEGLYQRTLEPQADPVEAAAYAEFGIDFAGHFFADGCGKTAKAVSAYMLMRADRPLPEYRGGRAAYYAHQLPQIAGQDPTADAAGYAKFLDYYRGLFDADDADGGETSTNGDSSDSDDNSESLANNTPQGATYA